MLVAYIKRLKNVSRVQYVKRRIIFPLSRYRDDLPLCLVVTVGIDSQTKFEHVVIFHYSIHALVVRCSNLSECNSFYLLLLCFKLPAVSRLVNSLGSDVLFGNEQAPIRSRTVSRREKRKQSGWQRGEKAAALSVTDFYHLFGSSELSRKAWKQIRFIVWLINNSREIQRIPVYALRGAWKEPIRADSAGISREGERRGQLSCCDLDASSQFLSRSKTFDVVAVYRHSSALISHFGPEMDA